MRLVLYLLLIFLLFAAVVLDKASHFLAPKELKRRARAGRDRKAAAIYKTVAYGQAFSLLIWTVGALVAAIVFVMAAHDSVWLAVLFIVAAAWAIRAWQPEASTESWLWSFAATTAPAVSRLLSLLQPLLGRLADIKIAPPRTRTGIYEKEDLQELVSAQNNQPENRIPELDLQMAFNSLAFGDKQVSDVMTPLRKVKLVSEGALIGPLLMDELHSTGFNRFPVAKEGTAKSATPTIVGTLFLRDLVDYQDKGKVKELMDKKVYFINEVQSLRSALEGFLKTHHHQFIVVNNFEEIAGVLTLEDVIEQIIGKEIVDEFDKYDDLRAVAGLEAKKDHQAHDHISEEPKTETLAETN